MELNSELDRLQKYAEIDSELNRAKKKWPDWPENIFEQLAIMQEEAGEVTMAVLHYVHEGGNIGDVKSELIHTAAMCMRMLENLPDGERVSHVKNSIEYTFYKFKPGDKVRIKDGISSKTHLFVEPFFTKGMNEFIGRKLTVNGYVPGYRYVNISESVYNFPEDWLEPYVEELKKGDLAIFWDNGVKHSASVRMYDGLFMRDYCDTGGVRWDNAIKFESIEQYEKLLRGEI